MVLCPRGADEPDDAVLTEEDLAAFRRATGGLHQALGRTPWPESGLLCHVFEQVNQWTDEREKERLKLSAHSRYLKDLLDQGRERQLLEEVGHGGFQRLAPGLLKETHEYLLDVLRFRQAHQLRKALQARVQLQPVWTRLAPLIAGVATGPILILDVGEAWNELVGRPLREAMTATGALLAAFALLVAQLASHVPRAPASPLGRVRTLLRVCARVIPVFAGALLLAGVLSGLVLWTLADTSLRKGSMPEQLLLWTPLSLFLGVFVGIIAQGRTVAVRER
jgi:hypothetical protein